MYCKHCGKQMADDAQFCPSCGGRIVTAEPQTTAQGNYATPSPTPKKKKGGAGKIALIVIGVIFMLSVVGNLLGGSDKEKPVSGTPSSSSKPSSGATQLTNSISEETERKNQAAKFDAKAVATQLDVKTLGYSNQFWNYAFLTIGNKSEYNLNIRTNVKFYDASGSLIGAKNSEQEAIQSGFDTVFVFMPDEKYAKMEYDLEISEEKYYDCVQSDLSYEATEARDKIILSVTNNGSDPAEFVEASVLFFNGEKLVGFSQTYTIDSDSELKPGKTIDKEMDCYEEFDSYQIYLSGRR